jgi:oligoendopeptidase F
LPIGSSFKATTWDLDEILPPELSKSEKLVTARLDSMLSGIEKTKEKLPVLGPEGVRAALELHEEVYDLMQRLQSLSYMKFSADTNDEKAKASLDKAEETRAEVENRLLFFRLWWTSLPDDRSRALEPPNPDYRYLLASWRRRKPFLLEEKVEQAVMTKNTTGSAEWAKHYSMITSDFTFALGPRRRGERARKVGFAEVSKLFASPRPDARKAAYEAFLAKYSENSKILGDVYRTIARDWRNENLKMRGFRNPISPRNLENDLPDAVVETLLESCRKNARVFREYFRLKAKLLGLKRLRRYDIYAPTVSKEKRVTYEDSARRVLAAFRSFDEGFASMATRVFEARHVDSTPRRGKEPGAYCMNVVPGVVPFLLLNFVGRVRDMYTMAHELGHAVHDQLASRHSVLTCQPPLVLAETASVFAEMILFDRFMQEEKDADLKRNVLAEKIAEAYAAIGRQAHFVLFEEEAHRAVGEGATVSELGSMYKSNLESQFQNSLVLADGFRWEWTAIPHIYHTPFYCYAYSFGDLLSLALYDRYTKEGKSFVPRYLRVLAYGGSESPAKILSEIGLDISSAEFWQSGFNVIERMVAQLEES